MNDLERHRQLLGFSVDGVHELDLRGRITRINTSGCATLCVTDPATALGQALASFWPEAAHDELEAALVAARTGRSMQFAQMLPSASGEPAWWLISVHPCVDTAHRVDGIAVISHDITEAVEVKRALDAAIVGLHSRLSLSESAGATSTARNESLDRQLARARVSHQRGADREQSLKLQLGLASAAQAVAEHAVQQAQKNEAIGQLVAGLSHDFANMLQIAIVALSSIQDDPANLTDSQRRLLGYSMDGVQHAARLAQRLLAFARVHSYTPEPVELVGIVRDIESFARHSLGAGMDFQVAPFASELPTMCDRHAIEQAFVNLCINARDACSRQGAIEVRLGELTVSPERGSTLRPAGDYVTLAVTDNGSGMDASVRERLFEPYFTTKPEGSGTGLGLAQVYGVVRQAGGFVDVESTPGAGTTMTMAFPRLHLPAGE
ncbi:MAG: PAS domain-containing sensor histidine kinase [Rhodanobacter sp.]|nr:MAG: PAS domain-containing sensor histidine kinase [Rhodanobacter sp.]TAL89237.1 MAG: PAS domain-containing sensor histidine kinase [Rhodanobacter sp.]TAM43112.1 MAG: PAS domain-containing sensor histidine kinase [Rhodanobacter sp.]TAN28827.1 MAG: PAS domain-containing sensor histidine kinase [Rhodanobacter sp.]